MNGKPLVLVVDDEVWAGEFLKDLLKSEGYRVEVAVDRDDTIEKIKRGVYDLVITDLRMGDYDGMEVLKTAKTQSYDPEVLLVTAHGSVESAVEALKLGAYDYLTKPLDSKRVLLTMKQALERRKLKAEIANLRGDKERTMGATRNDFLLYYDPLTRLPNRHLFFDRLEQAILRNEHTDRFLAILLLDVDGFNFINDAYGLSEGDRVLKELAKRLDASVYDRDTIARFGSDEFGVVAEVKKKEDIIPLLERIRTNVSKPMLVNGNEVIITTSIGISIYPSTCEDANALVRNTGLSLSQAKSRGRNSFQFFTDDMNTKASEFVSIQSGLSKALENEEFELWYQPYFDIKTDKPVGLEALLRWNNDRLGAVSPAKFIPVLEETKMIIPVGEWVCDTVCRQIVEWENTNLPAIPVAVNLSAVQFEQKNITERMIKIIQEYGIDPRLITFEITESTLMQDVEFTRSALQKFKDLGCSVSIDDFGTGYSSLAYLKRFPIDNLKIDISFIRGISTDPDDASIVSAVISMAHSLKLMTISEGVETEDQLRILRILRCDLSQGYYHSRPLPAKDIEPFLKGNAMQTNTKHDNLIKTHV